MKSKLRAWLPLKCSQQPPAVRGARPRLLPGCCSSRLAPQARRQSRRLTHIKVHLEVLEFVLLRALTSDTFLISGVCLDQRLLTTGWFLHRLNSRVSQRSQEKSDAPQLCSRLGQGPRRRGSGSQGRARRGLSLSGKAHRGLQTWAPGSWQLTGLVYFVRCLSCPASLMIENRLQGNQIWVSLNSRDKTESASLCSQSGAMLITPRGRPKNQGL